MVKIRDIPLTEKIRIGNRMHIKAQMLIKSPTVTRAKTAKIRTDAKQDAETIRRAGMTSTSPTATRAKTAGIRANAKQGAETIRHAGMTSISLMATRAKTAGIRAIAKQGAETIRRAEMMRTSPMDAQIMQVRDLTEKMTVPAQV